MPDVLKPYAKTITAVLGALLTIAVLVIDSPATEVTSGEVKAGLILVAAAFGVFMVPNRTP